MTSKWILAVCGCGTASYWIVRELSTWSTNALPERLILCDSARIREENAITCPDYKGHVGRPKCERLGELAASTWLPSRVDVQSIHRRVEQIQWEPVLRVAQAARTIVLVGLDRWPSRMAVAEDLRHLVAQASLDIMVIQVGLDRGQASIAVYGCQFSDPCPACGLLSLPGSEPCVVRTVNNKLLRGNLHSEAKAAAAVVHRILNDHCQANCGQSWLNTKIHLVSSSPPGKGFHQFTRPCNMAPDCRGPHASKTPIRWDLVLGSISCGKGLV